MTCGYGGLWLAASGRAAPPYWALVGLTAAAFAGGSWVDTACIATNVRNFPGHRGTVVGAQQLPPVVTRWPYPMSLCRLVSMRVCTAPLLLLLLSLICC